MKCPNCDYDNRESAPFCLGCGVALGAPGSADPVSVVTAPNTLQFGRGQEVALCITNNSQYTWKGLRFRLRDLRVEVSRSEVELAELPPGQTWTRQLTIEVVSKLEQIEVPFQLSWRDEKGRARRHQGKLAFDVKPSPNGDWIELAYALLVGVGDYVHPHLANLPATIRDAQAVAALLTDSTLCGYPSANVQLIRGPDATAANIRAALKSLVRSATPQSTALVYFSGHGGRALLPSSAPGKQARDGERWRAFLYPCEADPDDLAHTAISGDEFSAMLAAVPARKLLVILDACHAAGSAGLKAADGTLVWKAGLPDSYYESLSQGSGRVVIASSKEDQFSYVRPQGDLSLFTYHLRQALSGGAAVRGDGSIRVLDVFHYVNEAVHADEPRQTPILKVKDLDLNFAIALDRGGKRVRPKRAVPHIAAIRERIVRDPVAGAKTLSDYLATHTEPALSTAEVWAAKRTEVDLKRAELERIQHDLELFGPNENDKAARNRTVYFLLQVCMELERSER